MKQKNPIPKNSNKHHSNYNFSFKNALLQVMDVEEMSSHATQRSLPECSYEVDSETEIICGNITFISKPKLKQIKVLNFKVCTS